MFMTKSVISMSYDFLLRVIDSTFLVSGQITMLSIIFVIVCGFFNWKRVYVLLLEIKLSREESWDHINWFNPATIWCLSHGRAWIFSIIYCVLFCVQWVHLRWEVIVCFVDVGRIGDHFCFNFFFIIRVKSSLLKLLFISKGDNQNS